MNNIKEQVGPAEWQVRVDLAAAYRLAAMHRMTDHIYTHFSARVPGDQEHFLLNAYGLLFDEVTASNLVKVDLQGRIILDSTGLGINPAGFVIHSAIHAHRHDAQCVMHTHTAAGIAVSAQRQGLLMISQHAMRFYRRISYHDYEGVVLDMDEQAQIVASLGAHKAMILRNHGLLVCGDSVADAFDGLYYLERACQTQIAALAGGQELVVAPNAVAEKVGAQFDRPDRVSRAKQWPPFIRSLERIDPRYKD